MASADGMGRMVDLHAPAVEMLWEADDPDDALAERFGFSDRSSAGRWIAGMLAAHWGVRTDSCDRIVLSGRNALGWVATPSGRLIAKWSVAPERFPRLSEVARLTQWLGDHGTPVSAPVPALDGRLQVETQVGAASMSLQREIPAELLDTTDPRQVRAAGAALARLHQALAAYPEVDRVAGLDRAAAPADPAEQVGARITDWLESGADHVPPRAREALWRCTSDTPVDRLPWQLVHGDYRGSNILCTGAEVAAVLDLEEVTVDHRVVELARSAVRLGTRFRNWGPVSAEVRAEFLSGYRSVGELTPLEVSWWETLVLWQTLTLVPVGHDRDGWIGSALDQVDQLTRPGPAQSTGHR